VSNPPRLARLLLRALTPEGERDFVLGDMEEAFDRMCAVRGRRAAAWWYRAEVMRSVWALTTYPGRWEGMTMTGMVQDVRGAVRVFRRAPGFAAVVVVTLGLAVGGASAVYSVVRGVLLAPMSFEESDRVVMLWGRSSQYPRAPLTVGDHNVLVNDVESFSGVTAAWSNNALLIGEGEAEQVSVGWVTPSYFDVLGVRPGIGRIPEHFDESGVVLSHALWVRRYGADPAVVGDVIDVGGEAMQITGVLPADRDPNLTTFAGGKANHHLWRLQPPDWTQGDDRSVGWLRSTARLREGVTLAQAQDEVDALMTRVNATVTDRDGGTDLRVDLIPVKSDLVSAVSRALWILLAAVCSVLLIAASNVAHLVLARGEQRAGEVAVRAAIGGSRARLMRQLLVESGVLATAGGLLGFFLATVGVRLLVAMAPPTLPRLELVRLDWGVFAFSLAATAAAGLIFGLLPALRGSRADLTGALGDRSVTRDRRRQRLSRALVVAEVAMSVALISSTGLLLRSFAQLESVDLGFQREGVVTFALEVPEWGDSGAEAAATATAYLDRLRAVPGVEAAGLTNRVPLGGGLFTGSMRSEEMATSDAEAFEAAVRWITPGYLEAMGARLLAGRSFASDDGLGSVLLDERAAQRLWPGEDPLGRRIETSAIGEEARFAEVIGVVAPMKHHGVAEEADATVFLPMLARAHQQNFRYVAARVAGDPVAHVEGLRSAVKEVNGHAVIARIRTMDDLFTQDIAATRFASFLLTLFGVVALLLAAVGLHGVMAYSVRRRTREIGIRVVLGAPRSEILRDAMRSGAMLVVGGIALGAFLSLGAGELVRSLLFGIEPRDVPTLVAASATVLAVGLLSTYLPSRLVLGVDPAVTLREE
jgi:predicted permease